MPNRRLSYWLMSLLIMAATAAAGCRAPYPTYNPYGFYGQPCINPPGTGAYNPTGRTDPYYGAPANGVYPPNPYAPAAQYPGYPPVQQPAGATSQRSWNPQTSTESNPVPTVEPQDGGGSLMTAARGEWKSVDNPNATPAARTASLDTAASFQPDAAASSDVPVNNVARFDGFGRN